MQKTLIANPITSTPIKHSLQNPLPPFSTLPSHVSSSIQTQINTNKNRKTGEKKISNASTIQTNILKCPTCDYCTDPKVVIKMSLNEQSTDKPLICPSCDSKVKSEGNIKNHMEYHTDEKPENFPVAVSDIIPNDNKVSFNLFEHLPTSPTFSSLVSPNNQTHIEYDKCETNHCIICSSQFNSFIELSIHFNNLHIYELSQGRKN